MTITHRKTDCDGHVRFTFRTDAVGSAKRMRWTGRKVEVFGCAVCGGWHIGGTSWLKGRNGRPSPRVVRIETGGLGD